MTILARSIHRLVSMNIPDFDVRVLDKGIQLRRYRYDGEPISWWNNEQVVPFFSTPYKNNCTCWDRLAVWLRFCIPCFLKILLQVLRLASLQDAVNGLKHHSFIV